MCKISIVVPVYNVEKYLNRCVDSIINQTYKDLEIILVDDGSTDNCHSICDKYAKVDDRIKVIHKENGGLSDARNIGIENSTGKYISFVDSDDYIHYDMVSRLYKNIKSYKANIAICGYIKTYNDIEKFNEIEVNEIKCLNNIEAIDLLFDENLGSNFIVSWGKLYDIKLFKNILYPVGKIHEDEFTTYKLLYASEKIVYDSTPLYYYYQREDSIMNIKFNKNRMSIFDAFYEQIEFFYINGLDIEYKMAVERYIGHLFFCRDKCINLNNKSEIYKLLRKKQKQIIKIINKYNQYTQEKKQFVKAPWFNEKWLNLYWKYIGIYNKLGEFIKK
ncbi:MAG: glycosyltransferase family 2 protein [Intestinibacter sp.]|uniref:glycosyltransferase family 2 protein n=1 Tax=Intestinibacter sp. TaxID=1965304 RepID=UPI003F15D3CB